MASTLTKTIMNNISKKSLNKDNCSKQMYDYKSVDNINENEQELLKSILYKNKTKVNLNTLRSDNLSSKIEKNNADKKFIKYSQVEKIEPKKDINKTTSIKNLGNQKNKQKEKTTQSDINIIDNKVKVEAKSLKSLSTKTSNIKEKVAKDKKINNKVSLKDLAK